MRAALILSSVLIVVGGSDVQGQKKPAQPKADSTLRRIFYKSDSAMMNRAALGIELRPTGTRRDTLGVFVAAVTPRGPAETAGIIEGDRIAAINGIDLRSAAADVEDDYTNGVPAHRLSREVQKLAPGARITLRVYSAGRFRDVVVTAGRASEVMRHAGGFGFRRLGPGAGMKFRGLERGMEFRGPDGAMMFTPGMPLRIERFGPTGPTRIRSLPRKTPLRVEQMPSEEAYEILSESLPELELMPEEESEAIKLEIEREGELIET